MFLNDYEAQLSLIHVSWCAREHNSIPTGLITNLLGYGKHVGLIRLRHTHVSPLPLFIFSQPDICISHELPQPVLWSEAEMDKVWLNQGVSTCGLMMHTTVRLHLKEPVQ